MSVVVLLTIVGVSIAALTLFGAFVSWLVKRAVDWEDFKATLRGTAKANDENTVAVRKLDETVRAVGEKQMAMFFEHGQRLTAVERHLGLLHPSWSRNYGDDNED